MSDLKKATEVMQLINGNDQQRHKGFDLFNRYFTMEFIRFLQNRGLSYEDAKDVCQMTTIKIFKKADTLKELAYARTWMYQILRRTLFDFSKTKQNYQKIFEEYDESTLIDSDGFNKIQTSSSESSLINHIPGKYQDRSSCVSGELDKFSIENPERAHALRLQMDGFDISFIADCIGRTSGATKEYLNQSRKKLAPWLEKCLKMDVF